MLKPLNPCPVCGAETALAEIEPHPLHVNFDIHGYLWDCCGPVNSLVVLRSWSPRFFSEPERVRPGFLCMLIPTHRPRIQERATTNN
jgi:hypothetical protein